MKSESIKIECSSCYEHLASILSYDKELDIEIKIRCLCPFCGDRSYYKTLTNKFYVEASSKTRVINSEQQEDGCLTVIMEKI